MAKKKYDSEDGVWRTIGGRRVFIRTGASLSQAMKESGKFKNMRKDVADNVKFKDMEEDTIKREGVTAKEYQKAEDNVAQLKKEKNALEIEVGEYDDDDMMRGSPAHDEVRWALQNKEDELREAQKKYNNLMKKDGHLERKYKMPTKNEEYEKKEFDREKFNKWVNKNSDKNIREYEKETGKDALHNNGDPTKDFSDYEYELYKRAKENPDSIDPMTENSTDWEALDKKYSGRYEKENKYVKTLSGEYEKDNKGRKVTQKEYDDFRQAYRDGKISKEDYKNDNYEYKKANLGFAREVYKGGQKTLELERDNYERAKKNGASVEDLSHRKRFINELELENQKNEFDYNKALKNRYSGTYDYLQNTTNMSGAEILELLKKIDEDRK